MDFGANGKPTRRVGGGRSSPGTTHHRVLGWRVMSSQGHSTHSTTARGRRKSRGCREKPCRLPINAQVVPCHLHMMVQG